MASITILPSSARMLSFGVLSRVGTTNTTNAMPLTSSGTPMAAASTTSGCATSTDSTSAGPRRLPPILSVSSERPRMYHRPSESMAAKSPCIQTFSQRDQ